MSTLNVATVNATTTLNTSSINGGQLAGFRNRIINGDMRVNQRGAITGIASTKYSVDRWRFSNTSAAVLNANSVSGYLEFDVTTADASVAAGDVAFVSQRIEAYNIEDFNLGTASAVTVTLSFKHKHTKTGTYCVAFQNAAKSRSYVAEYTQAVSDTEETATITLTLDTTGTWAATTNIGLAVFFAMMGGSTYQTTADAWAAGEYYATSNQVNSLDSTSNYFRITDVQLEIGSEATPFEQRPFGTELALCQRYFEKSYDLATSPGTVATNGQSYWVAPGSLGRMPISFQTKKRTVPTIIFYSPATGATAKVRDVTSSTDVSTSAANTGEQATLSVYTSSDTREYSQHWTASAEL